MGNGRIDETIDGLLVNLILIVDLDGRPAHTAVAEKRHLFPCLGIGAVFHLVGRNLRVGGEIAGDDIILGVTSGKPDTYHRRADTHTFEETAAAETFIIFVVHCVVVCDLEELDGTVYFMAFDIDGAERTRGTEIFARSASDAPLSVDYRYFDRIGV